MSKSIEIDNLINNQLYGFRIFPRNLKGQYQTEIDGATATATPKAFSLPTYTGQYTIFGNEIEGRIEMYTSGTLTLSPATYDMFVVGGGGGATTNGSGGGGGGYTATKLQHQILNVLNLNVLIGSESGNTTVIENIIAANGGEDGKGNGLGGDGGSGGGGAHRDGGYGGQGGSDGTDGKTVQTSITGGSGQGRTTRAFSELGNTLYAGGGGGYGKPQGGSGGSGGGGNGGKPYEKGTNGTPNTGGGGGGTSGEEGTRGGSGIAIIRWKNN